MFVAALTIAPLAHARVPVVLSTDIGNEIDDQWAIAYMMVNPDFDVRGVISAHAPSIPDPAGQHSYLLLRDEIENHLGMHVHPPIFPGADVELKDAHTPIVNDAVRFLIEQSKSFSSQERLTVLTIGAATDTASAILADPSIVDRIRVVAMAFTSESDAKEYNVQNDVVAWQVLLNSKAPLVIGPGSVCRADLALSYDAAHKLLVEDGPIGSWLWDEYDAWYFRQVKPLRKNDFSKPWMIWDIITLAYLEGFDTTETKPRPTLNDDLTMTQAAGNNTVTWITHVDSVRLWGDFQARIAMYLRTHDVPVWP
jgi:inosine-uridine nucleoside N-ribohydrolase